MTSYNLRWDAGSNGLEWHSLIGLESDNLETEFIVSDNIIGGQIYNFQVRSKNKWGWSDYSSVASIKASTWPILATAPETSINPVDGAVVVKWDEPDASGSEIILYLVELFDLLSNDWTVELTNCDGLDADVISGRQCNIPMSVFTSSLGY